MRWQTDEPVVCFFPVDVANTVMLKFGFPAKTATCETALTLAPTEWKASFLLRPCLDALCIPSVPWGGQLVPWRAWLRIPPRLTYIGFDQLT